PFDARQIDTVEQHGQLCRPQHQAMLADARPLAVRDRQGEGALFQTLVPDGQAVLVPPEQLDAIAPPAAKHEQIAPQRTLAQVLLHHARQGIKTFAHVGRQRAHEYPAGQRQAQHDGSSNTRTSWRSRSASKPARTRRVRPVASTNSMAAGSAAPGVATWM